ncbi:hypothetical protein PHEL49_1467 [Polaribacter sp. Hel1_33_49]|nr:hypothetical protein PHEL49_1467 [Polaribacter sp. Hel1_33_49]
MIKKNEVIKFYLPMAQQLSYLNKIMKGLILNNWLSINYN